MSTFWERMTGLGLQDPQELLDLVLVRNVLTLRGWGTIEPGPSNVLMGLTLEQGAELAHFLNNTALQGFDQIKDRLLYLCEGARLGVPELDEIVKVQTQLEYTAPEP